MNPAKWLCFIIKWKISVTKRLKGCEIITNYYSFAFTMEIYEIVCYNVSASGKYAY